MMQRAFGFFGAATLAAILCSTGCISDDGGGTTPGADTGGGGSDTGGGGTDTGGGGTDTGGGGTDTGGGGDTAKDATAAPTCEAYCTENIATCTGENVQYIDKATCLAMCAKMNVGGGGDTAGDTLGCRAYHTGAAKTDAAAAKTHCPHSGAYGGAVCGDSRCANYCKLAVDLCGTVSGATFTTVAACLTDCNAASFDATKKEIDSAAVGKTNCTQYHLQAAATTPTPHCGHLTTASGPCKAP